MTFEVATRLAARGHSITWLSSAEPGLPSEETIGGVRIVRRGTELTTRIYAPAFARDVRPDAIVEEINTLPYGAPVWSSVPVLLFMHQLARDVWWYEAPKVVAALGWVVEPLYLQVFRRCDAVTVSRSTRDDLRRMCVGGTITVLPQFVPVDPFDSLPQKRRDGSMIAIGRLTPSKRYDHAIEALALLRRDKPQATLTIIGEGREEPRLRRIADRAGVANEVRFLGRVSEDEKIAAIDRSDVLVGTSVREGWGLTVTEAAMRNTPSVVYDIPGFRDSVVGGRSGDIVPPRPSALAKGVSELVRDRARYERLGRAACSLAMGRTYDGAADAFEQALLRCRSRARGEAH